MPAPVRPRSGVALGRLAFVLLAAVSLVTCTEEPTSPTRPGVGTLRVTPHFNPYARLVPLTLDNVRVIVVRPPTDTILRAARSFSPGTQQLTLSLPVLLLSSSEALQVTLELYAGSTLLFTGTSTVQVAAGASTPPASVPVSYQGPGATLATLTLAPRDTSVTLGATFPFGATAVDAQQNNVPQFYVSWSADAGTIDAAGVFIAPQTRDTLYVHGVTPNGVRDSTRVFVTAPPSSLTKTGGDGQSGIVGTRLPQMLAVRVNGSDGQPVPGAVVAFTVTTGGGSVDSATATTDAQGIARTGAVLGLTLGQQTFTASVSGIPATVFTATATGVAPVVVTLAAGGNHTCEIRGTQTLCWGDNSTGQLGDGSTTDRAVPGPVSGAFTFTSLAAGDGHTCALTAAGQAFCWGENFSGSLGDGTTNASSTPVAVSGGRSFVALTAGEEFTCGLTAAGQAFCWGYNFDGQLGVGGNADQLVPVPVSGGLSFTSLDAGVDHTCALTVTGQAFCWGSNAEGQLGDGTSVDKNVPTAVTGGLSFSAIHAGSEFSCGIASSGAGFCWGINFGIPLTSPQPVAGGFTYTALAGGDNHICGLTTGGWRCGGDNGSGQLGDGTTTDRVSPVLPAGGFTFTALAGGAQHTCGRTSSGTRCWGSNTVGQLGDGSNTNQLTPTLSVGPATTAAVSAGNGQTATAGTAVPIPPAIVVRDALNNPVPGLDVVFAVTGGGGSVTGATTQTDAAGVATVGTWTLGAAAGANSLSATVQVGGVSGNPVAFTATGTAPSAITWNGSASTAWSDPNNWTPAVVPGSTQDVLIPSGPSNMPVLSATATIGSLTLQAGAALTLVGNMTLTVTGDLDDAGNLTSGGGGTQTVVLAGTGRSARFTPIPVAVSVTGSYTLNGSATVASPFSISGGSASLTVGGQALIVNSLSVGSGGSLVMTDPADVVVVSGNVAMGGGDHTGKLTAGQIQVQGSFTQTSGGSVNSFVATGNHAVIMTGAGGTITFQSPGSGASRFNRLLFGVGTFTGVASSLGSRVVVGESAFLNGGSLTLAGRTLEVTGDFVVLPTTGSRLTMTNGLDSLLVGGNASFDGESELTFMSAGVLLIGGNLTQQNAISPDAFHPSGTHKTVLTGSNPTLSFATPGLVPGSSHFQLLDWSGAGTLTLLSDVYAHGQFRSLATGTTTITSATDVLTVGGFSAAGPVTINSTDLTLDMPGGGALTLGNLTFTNASPSASQLEVMHPGTGGPFTFTNLTFTTTPTTGGNYLRITDTDGPSPDALTVNMVNPNPASDAGFSQALNGAVINWPFATPGITWLGTTSTAWSTGANWSGGQAPTPSQDVIIPAGTPFSPVVSTSCDARDLTVDPGATMNVGNFGCQVFRNLLVNGTITGTVGVTMLGGGSVLGDLPGLIVSSAVTVTGTTSVSGGLIINGAGSLTIAGHTVTVSQNLTTTGSGILVMNTGSDVVSVAGNASFSGGDETGSLTAGLLTVGGSLTQTAGSSSASLVSSGTHVIALTSASAFMQFQVPGPSGNSSRLQALTWPGNGTLTLGSGAYIGTLTVSSAGTIAGQTFTQSLHLGQLLHSGQLTFFNAQLWIETTLPDPVSLSGLTFTNGSGITSFLIRHPGLPAGGRLMLDQVAFTNVPSFPAVYLDVDDTAPVDGNPLVVDVSNATPSSPSGLVLATNGAVINWPAAAPAKTWLGVTQDWHTTSNWSPAGVPTASDDVVIGSAPNQPILSANATARDLTIQSGVLLNLNGFTLDVTGSVSAPAATSLIGSGGVLQLSGTGGSLAGNLSTTLAVTITGTYSLAGRTTVGGLTMAGSGDLAMNNNTLVVGGALNTTGSGAITMNNPLDSVLVSGAGIFGGGDETGRLTAGYLKIGGSFSQTSGTSTSSFSATAPHKTELGAAAVRVVTFANPGLALGTSHFGDLEVSGATGGLTLNSDAFGLGELISLPPGATPIVSAVSKRLITFDGLRVNGLSLDNVQVVTSGVLAIAQFDNVAINNIAVGDALAINDPGRVTPYVFNSISFNTVPAGNYIAATDLAQADGVMLTIDMVNPNPASASGKIAVSGAIVNWPASAPAAVWTGTVSADWHTAANWDIGSVPGPATDVTIGAGTPNSPVLLAPAVVGDLRVQNTATLDLGGFTLTNNGLLDALGANIIGAPGSRIVMAGTNALMQGLAGVDMTIAGSAVLGGPFTLSGSLLVQGPLNLNGTVLTVGGDLVTQGAAAVIRMVNGGEGLIVSGNATFDGGNQLGFMSTGVFQLGGNFAQFNTHSGDSFHPSGAHTTVLTGSSINLNFATPGDVPGTSHFQQLMWSNGGALTLASDVYAHDAFTFNAGLQSNFVTSLTAGFKLSVGRVVMTSAAVTFDNIPLVINQPSGALPIDFDHVTFQNMDPTVTQLSVLHTGTGGPFLFSDMTFSTTPTTGFYLSATDTDGGAPLTINMVNANPATPGGFLQTVNGAAVNWPAGGPVIIWNGSADTDWFNPANWNGGVVPTSLDNVLIPSGAPNYPDVGNITVNDLTIQSGASLTSSDHTLTVNGNLDVAGSLVGCCDIRMTGSGVTARGAMDGYSLGVEPGAQVSLNGSLTLTGLTPLNIQGELIVGGQILTTATLATFNGGVLEMTNSSDFVQVTTASFAGGDETGRLTAGVLLAQNFTQSVGTSGHQTSFFAGGSHFTNLPGTASVSFQTPLASRFQHLDLSGATSVTMATDVTVAGILAGGTTPVVIQTTAPGAKLTAGGGLPAGAAVTFDNVPLVLSGGVLFGMSNVAFTNMDPAVTQLTINNVGSPTPVALDNLTFQTTPTSGLYLVVNDLDGPSPDALTVNVTSTSPASGDPFTQAVNGAVLNWPAGGGSSITWSGSASTDWFDPANWVGGVVPTNVDNVLVGPGGNQPVLTSSTAINDLTVQTGATLEIGDFVLVINGNVDVAGTVDDLTGTGAGGVTLSGNGVVFRGALLTAVIQGGSSSAALNGPLTTGDLTLFGALGVGGQVLDVQGALVVSGAGGLLNMTNPADAVNVTGAAFFDGSNSVGWLSAGTLTIGGDFAQFASNSAQSFAADPGHLTVLSADPASITFTTPGPNGSHFGDLSEAGFGAVFNLGSDVTIAGNLSGGDGFGGQLINNGCPSPIIFTVTDIFGGATFNCVQLVVNDPGGTTSGLFASIDFTNMPNDVPQMTIRHPGAAYGTNNLTFVPLTLGDLGRYIDAVDTDASAPFLVVSPFSTNVTDGPTFTSTSGGASVVWP
jgi:alpha-tubulin suppressor-like RCC1 family protein